MYIKSTFSKFKSLYSSYSSQYLAQFFLEWEMFQTKFVEKFKTHIFCSITFFQKSFSLWNNVEKYFQTTDDNTIWRMRFACCIPKATDRYSEYVILIAIPLQQWLRLNVASQIHASLVIFIVGCQCRVILIGCVTHKHW